MTRIELRLAIIELLIEDKEIYNVREIFDMAEQIEEWITRDTTTQDYVLN